MIRLLSLLVLCGPATAAEPAWTATALARHVDHRGVEEVGFDMPRLAERPISAGLSVEAALGGRFGLAGFVALAPPQGVPAPRLLAAVSNPFADDRVLPSGGLEARAYVLGAFDRGLFVGAQAAAARLEYVGGWTNPRPVELQILPVAGFKARAWSGLTVQAVAGAGWSGRTDGPLTVVQAGVGWTE